MMKQKVEIYKLKGDSYDMDNINPQINIIIEKLNSEGKRVLSFDFRAGLLVGFLYEYEE